MSEQERLLREQGEHIAHLLAEIEAAAGPQTWTRVEALVASLTQLYGAGMQRLLAYARDTSAGDIDARVGSDELLASLFAVHGVPTKPAAPKPAPPPPALIGADRLVRGRP